MSRFFIDRPIFAWVIAIVIMLVGALSISKLPINQYPAIAPPAIAITGTYPGASAQTVQDTVVQVVEQQLNGLDGLRYIESQSTSDGGITIMATFDQGTNPDIAQVQVQNKLALATPLLPQEVQSQGLRVVKYQLNFMLVMSLVSEDGKMSNADLGNLLVSKMQDPILRTKGVGDFQLLGSQYAMRIWLDPAKLNKYQLTTTDVQTAVENQNVQVSSGALGGLPSKEGTEFTATVIGKTRFTTPEQFKNILLKVDQSGRQVRMRDVANVALGPDNYSISSKFNGSPSAGIALRLQTGANLLDTVNGVRKTVDGLKQYLPAGVKVEYPYDTSPVVSASIEEVVKTLVEAIILVVIVMYVFLQNIRATLVPTLVVPVVLLGTFGVIGALGYSINTLTMFGMVLAIGLLVDDAIVVVENVERVMTEEQLSPLEATRKSMAEVSGALVGIAMVLTAVLLPMAFMSGSTGTIFRQFSVTIVTAMVLSVAMAIIFTPALCATILKATPHTERKGFFGAFNRGFDRTNDHYTSGVKKILKHRAAFLVIYAAIVVAMAFLFVRLPTGFLPDEDQATFIVQVQLPANASAARTEQIMTDVKDYFLTKESSGVKSVFTVTGFSFAGRGQSTGMAFVSLKPWSQRGGDSSVFAIAARATKHFAGVKAGKIIPIVPPAILELGNATGFDFYLQDSGNQGHDALMVARNRFLQLASQDPKLTLVRPNGQDDEPQYQLKIDEERASAMGVSLADVNNTVQSAWGSTYVNQFVDQGRTQKVYLQGRAAARQSPESFNEWYVRNDKGGMVPFNAFSTGEWTYGSPRLERFNGIPSVELMGAPAAGYSSGDAVAEVNKIAAQLPKGFTVNWHGMSYEEALSGSQAPGLYAISLIVVFLCLAALYESWSIPFAVLLVVPLGIIGAVAATGLRSLTNDVFFQVGLLVTVGLASKNAILIVEFAKEFHEKEGQDIVTASINAARLRLRPIIMTSLAFFLGVLPLTMSSGAGAGSQHDIGTSVAGGMAAATLLVVLFVPLFYVVVTQLFSRGKKKKEAIGHE